jgi:hypothetical protein
MDSHDVRHLLDLVKQQNEGLRRVIAERDKLRAELDAFVAWANSDMDALGFLQRTYNDPNASIANRTKSALGAVHFERAKPPSASIVGTINLYEALEAKPPVTIEHSAPLASDRAGEALAGPEADLRRREARRRTRDWFDVLCRVRKGVPSDPQSGRCCVWSLGTGVPHRLQRGDGTRLRRLLRSGHQNF